MNGVPRRSKNARCVFTQERSKIVGMARRRLTLNLRDRAGEDILLHLGVTEALEDGVDNGLDEVRLLALLGLLLKADPRVENGLDLCREGNLLALDKRLGLELRRLLLGGREHISNVESDGDAAKRR